MSEWANALGQFGLGGDASQQGAWGFTDAQQQQQEAALELVRQAAAAQLATVLAQQGQAAASQDSSASFINAWQTDADAFIRELKQKTEADQMKQRQEEALAIELRNRVLEEQKKQKAQEEARAIEVSRRDRDRDRDRGRDRSRSRRKDEVAVVEEDTREKKRGMVSKWFEKDFGGWGFIEQFDGNPNLYFTIQGADKPKPERFQQVTYKVRFNAKQNKEEAEDVEWDQTLTRAKGMGKTPTKEAFRYKTTMCVHFPSGQCRLGVNCTYAHGKEELGMSMLDIVNKNAVEQAERAKLAAQGLEYVVDNSQLKASSPGLLFRNSKEMSDVCPIQGAFWGSTVKGLDEGDGWIKVGQLYLPMKTRGCQVLTLKKAEQDVSTPEYQAQMQNVFQKFGLLG